jgi:hypothetical protein
VILRRKSLHKPGWQLGRHRTVQVKRLLLGNGMSHSIPVQCGFAADVKSEDPYAPTVEGKDGVQGPRPVAQTPLLPSDSASQHGHNERQDRQICRTNLPSSTPPQPQPRQPSTQPTHLSERPGTSNSFVDEHHSTRSTRLKQAASDKFFPRLRARPSR